MKKNDNLDNSNQPKKKISIFEIILIVIIVLALGIMVWFSYQTYIKQMGDAAIRGDLSQIRVDVEIDLDEKETLDEYQIPGEFTSPECSNSPYNINKNQESYAIYGELCSEEAYYCVDSEGNNKVTANDSGYLCE